MFIVNFLLKYIKDMWGNTHLSTYTPHTIAVIS